MRINTNVAAMNSYNQLKNTNNNMSQSLERLSSGKRINRAADDAAGLAISEKMKGQMNGLAQAQRNAQDGISMIQTAEGALNESQSILQRMRELSVQSANDSNTDADRAEIQKEVDQLASELTRISNTTEFNTQTLLNGGIENEKGGDITFQIGANEGQDMNLSVNAMDAESLGVADVGYGAEVASGATAISSADVDRSVVAGSGITEGTSVDISSVSGVTAEGSTDMASGTVTITAASGGTELNDLQIEFSDDDSATSGITTTYNSGKVTVAGDWDASNSGTAATNNWSDIQAAINSGIDSGGYSTDITLDSGGTSISGITDSTITLDGGMEAASGETIAKFDAGSGNVQYEKVSTDTEEVSVDDGYLKGLQFTTSDVTSASGTVNITEQESTVAQFDDNGNKTADAVAAAGIDVSSQEKANEAIATLDDAINQVSQERSKLGAVQNRLDHTINNLSTAEENLTAANSRIRDVDMASEMMNMSKQRILSQAGTAMLAQANQKSQGVMQLLG